jgi:SnoaL-like polyketide cyclase
MSAHPTNAATLNAKLAEPWRQLWNGDLSITDRILAEDFVAHAAPITGVGDDEIHGRDALNRWVGGINTLLPDLNFEITVGPIATDDYLVVRWKAQGTYGGGFPGAADDAVGSVMTFTGTDTLRVVDGMLAEYWANADSLLFVQQLGIREVPGTRG